MPVLLDKINRKENVKLDVTKDRNNSINIDVEAWCIFDYRKL